MKKITILGSTGSIGKSTLRVISEHPSLFEVFALCAKSNVDELFLQCQTFKPRYAVLVDPSKGLNLKNRLKTAGLKTELLLGAKALEEVASSHEVDYVMAAIVGAAGLLPTLAAAKAGKRVLLANKEALIMTGHLFMEAVRDSNATLLPVDSEHNAIFQCMPAGYRAGEKPSCVESVILTASGGPFRTLPLSDFEEITVEKAIAHPTWNMGPKISVDSATLMNKAFEVIEAYWLFKLNIHQIEVVIHPQSIIHSFVNYQDGSMLAQLGSPDMCTPIAYTLSWPMRLTTSVKKLKLTEMHSLTFEAVDPNRFPSLSLAYQALRVGGDSSALLNAANEVGVAAFLEKEIKFPEIMHVVNEVLDRVPNSPINTIDEVLNTDHLARTIARDFITSKLLVT